jgi:hypothetical protein
MDETRAGELFSKVEENPGTELARVDSGDLLIQRAIDGKVDIESLRAIIEMRNAEREYQTRAEYARRFSAMQADFVPVYKTAEAKKPNGELLYKYAALEDVLAMVAPIMARHGFAVRWVEETGPAGELRITCIISGWGHEERSFVDIPIAEATSFTNRAQQRGVATTYGKRYSLINALGIQIAGEDTDGAVSIADSMRMAPELVEIASAPTMEALSDAFGRLWKIHAGDDAARNVIAQAKDERKAQLGGTK